MSAHTPQKNELQSAASQAGNTILSRKPKIINVGLDGFADELSQQAVPVVRVAWTPPAGGDAKLAQLLAKLGV